MPFFWRLLTSLLSSLGLDDCADLRRQLSTALLVAQQLEQPGVVLVEVSDHSEGTVGLGHGDSGKG